MVDTLLGKGRFLAIFGAISPRFYFFTILCFDCVLGAYVCQRSLTGLLNDIIVVTLLGKTCFLAVLGAYVCP